MLTNVSIQQNIEGQRKQYRKKNKDPLWHAYTATFLFVNGLQSWKTWRFLVRYQKGWCHFTPVLHVSNVFHHFLHATKAFDNSLFWCKKSMEKEKDADQEDCIEQWKCCCSRIPGENHLWKPWNYIEFHGEIPKQQAVGNNVRLIYNEQIGQISCLELYKGQVNSDWVLNLELQNFN